MISDCHGECRSKKSKCLSDMAEVRCHFVFYNLHVWTPLIRPSTEAVKREHESLFSIPATLLLHETYCNSFTVALSCIVSMSSSVFTLCSTMILRMSVFWILYKLIFNSDAESIYLFLVKHSHVYLWLLASLIYSICGGISYTGKSRMQNKR